jgi:iron complex transport system ATP-binding protein
MPMLDVDRLSVRYGTKQIVDALSFSVSEGQWLMIAGPNGAGKSTALAAITQGTPYTGRVLFEGQNVRSMKPALRARAIGVLAQNHFVGYGFTVEEVVRLGRFAYAGGVFGRSREDDAGHVEQALTLTGLQDKRRQSVLTLSGGELQRVLLALALEPMPNMLILDEPLSGVDVEGMALLMDMLDEIRHKFDLSILMTTHDFSMLERYADRVVLLRERVLRAGTPQEVLSSDEFAQVFHMRGGSAE